MGGDKWYVITGPQELGAGNTGRAFDLETSTDPPVEPAKKFEFIINLKTAKRFSPILRHSLLHRIREERW
jgi:hypothetical protein